MYDLYSCLLDERTVVLLPQGENLEEKLPHHSRIVLGELDFVGTIPDEFQAAEKLGIETDKLLGAMQDNGYLIYRKPRSLGFEPSLH